MNRFSNISGDIIRKAGKTTLILQVLSAALLIVLVMLFADISSRFRDLQDGIRENVVWSAYQLDREVRGLDHDLAELASGRAAHPTQTQALSALVRHYKDVSSRAAAIRQSLQADHFSGDRVVDAMVTAIEADVQELAPLIDGLVPTGDLNRAAVSALDRAIVLLAARTDELLLHTNEKLKDERAESQAAVRELERTSVIMLVLLMASVIFLVVTLRRQLKSVRAAGLSLEAMTHELTDAYEAADAGNRAKSQFMATMGHEIRTPLNAILGMAELLQLSKLPDDAAASVKTIRASGEALLEVINEILDYSKIEHGKLELEERAVDIRSLAESTVGIIRGRADEHCNTVVLDIPDSLHARYVRTDPTRLRQVLLNLLSNAVKFTSEGTVTLRLREFYRDSALMLRFEVEDTGIGIEESGIEKLFKPFSQVDASISRKYGGTGLGLTICKQIVEKLGGELGMSSTVGVGSIFWFELAVTPTVREEVRHQTRINELLEDLPHLRILLVEDNAVNQQVAVRFLERLGQDVTVAADGVEALDLTSREDFDLILMDMQMPVMDGIEATRRILERGGRAAATPIVAMTANASDDDRRRCAEAGMSGFESKPVTMERLRSVIAHHAAGPEPQVEVDYTAEAASAEDLNPFAGIDELVGFDEARQNELLDALGEDVFRELMECFFTDADQLIGELQDVVAKGEPQAVDRVLHTIKGAAVNVGLNGIAERAHALRQTPPTPADIQDLSGEIEFMKSRLVA
ncbi:ATP-binding protein [Ciceribacter sp. L1K22]|uniref:ATP-binding protein n=1 Tax=Ciceribacter sp. L1K22 TaxID=2820275 RepID=UPI001ABE8C78|nr:ATP-binding protein [Ciceribacter sp. L1K22]MBO3758854.1 response regulator [Ciceribacter sp. L1K22]